MQAPVLSCAPPGLGAGGFGPLADRPRGVAWRRPLHPGWWLAHCCLNPLSLTQSEAARLLGMSRRRLHELVHGQRTMTADTALRCARHFGIAVDFWLTRQAAWDAFQAWQRQARDGARACPPSLS